ncbi:MAG TPA: NAD(P)H-binding protein [Vitreimonas sp.]|uniref:NAD-dependent epimerase/dehydratase family protein n=1 Tax=Vitreimonas sp. TaxID=3069702 RepID=UPI002D4DC97E|nr:NAD(P)H-binding protein [Vitreimonas sp.]HYD86674.1 NAD(P)H-binding protein [Vitreimonas sp.]
METIAILGANGVYGRWLTPRLVAAGYAVRALVRRPEAAGVAAGCGADIRVADIFDEASLVAGLEGCDLGVNLATSLPGPSGRGTYEANDRVRSEGTPIWTAACRKAGVQRVIQQSIAMLSASGTDEWSDEETIFPADDSVTGRALAASAAMEKAIRASDLDWLILRGGLFYGPGTGFDDDWFARARAGKLRLPGDGSDFVSLLHIADMAAATLAAVQKWPSRQTLIIADDEPARWKDVFSFIAQSAGAPAPEAGGRAGFPSFRVSNRRARAALNWAPFYTNYRVGLVR